MIFLNILCVAAQNFSNAPCLGIATTAGMRGITVKNFGNRTNAALFQKVGLYRCKICHCLFFCFRRVVVDFHVSGQKAAHQKSPCGSLMVSGISFRKRATVDPVIVFVFRREGAYAGAGKQLFLYGIYHLQSLFGREHGMWKADGIDLVGADACIFAVFFNNVIETSVFFVPEFFSERSRYTSGKLAVNGGIFFEMFCQFRSHAQRIVPQCIDFYRFSVG